jgi:hypothetical protein
MIAPEVVVVIEGLLSKGGLSHRAIARATGINRGTVGLIARGQRPDYEALREARKNRLPRKRGRVGQQCPECHASVYLPCVACNTRQNRTCSSLPQSVSTGLEQLEEPLGLDMKERHRLRYEKIHERRLCATAAVADIERSAKNNAVSSGGKGFGQVKALLKDIQQNSPEKNKKRTALQKETESCFQWCDVPVSIHTRRRRKSRAVANSVKTEVLK